MFHNIITKPEVFLLDPFAYVPKILHGRTQQLAKLKQIHSDITGERRHYTMVVLHGSRGTGKTLTLRRFIKESRENPSNIQYIHIKGSTSVMKAVRETKTPFFFGKLVPKTMEACIDALVNAVKEKNSKLKRLIIIFDDAQLYDIRNLSPMLRYIWETYNQLVTPFLVTNIPLKKFFTRIAEDTLSRYSFNVSGETIPFSNYTFHETNWILNQRAEEGLEPKSWNENITEEIAKYSVETADIRNGIEMLKLVAEQTPSGSQILSSTLEQAKQKASILTTASDLQVLPLTTRIYLLAITIASFNNPSKRGVTLNQVETRHHKICRNLNTTPPSRATVWRMRDVLKNDVGIINTFKLAYTIPDSVGRSRRGSTSYLKLKEKPETLLKALKRVEWNELWDEGALMVQNIINQVLITQL